MDDGALGRFDAIDPTDGGAARRYSLSGVWRRTDGRLGIEGQRLRDPQPARPVSRTSPTSWTTRSTATSSPSRTGASPAALNAQHTWHVHRGDTMTSRPHGRRCRLQNDNIFNGLYNTRARQRAVDHARRTTSSRPARRPVVENATRWNDALRTVAGVRADDYRFDVRSDLAANSGRASDSLVSPSLSLVFGPVGADRVLRQLRARLSQQRRARHGRHASIRRRGEAVGQRAGPGALARPGAGPAHRSDPEDADRAVAVPARLRFRADATSATTAPPRPGRRAGATASSSRTTTSRSSGCRSTSTPRSRGRARAASTPAGDRIPGAVEGVGQLALTVDQLGPWSGALRLRYFGPRPLIEDNSVRSQRQPDAERPHRLPRSARTLRLELEGFNLANRRDVGDRLLLRVAAAGRSRGARRTSTSTRSSRARCASRSSRTGKAQDGVLGKSATLPA